MSIEFTHVPTTSQQHLPQYLTPAADALGSRLVLEGNFSHLVIDGPAGILANMDVAAEMIRATSNIGIVLTHWSGVMSPVAAAEQIAELDRLSCGRLSLRLLGPDGSANAGKHGHADSLRQTDEYLVLLKRLWSNQQPFDHEGPHYSVHAGFVERKGWQGADLPIRMSGVSGIAIDVAGKHATVFELAAGTPDETRELMQRVEAAAARYGRAGKIRFALPVLLAGKGNAYEARGFNSVQLAGPAAHIAQTLFLYASLGIQEFMVSGADDRRSIDAFARNIAPLFQRTVPINVRNRDGKLVRSAGQRIWAG